MKLVSSIPSTAEYLDLASQSKLVITFRMHPAILSLKVGTPVVMFDYQDKMIGLARDLDIQDFCITSTDWIATGAKVIERALVESQLLEAQITNKMPEIVLRSKSNWNLQSHEESQ